MRSSLNYLGYPKFKHHQTRTFGSRKTRLCRNLTRVGVSEAQKLEPWRLLVLEPEVEVLTITLYLEAHVNPFDDLPFPIH